MGATGKEVGKRTVDAKTTRRALNGIRREHIELAIDDLANGVPHEFGDSTGYDVLHEGCRYFPKAVIGIAAGKFIGTPLGPYDFKGGLKSKCFRILEANGFTIVTKDDTSPYADEVDETVGHIEGAVLQVFVNRYERDQEARRRCIDHYGAVCCVCDFDFARMYGAIGQGFIHVHHIVPLSVIRDAYHVHPIRDLRPVCPNCHAMLHKRKSGGPYSIEELRSILSELRRVNHTNVRPACDPAVHR